jgi:uncharacterized membrane protein
MNTLPLPAAALAKAPAAAVNATRWLAVVATLSLVVLGMGWELAWAPLRPGGTWWALKVLPLCFALKGLLVMRLYTYRWLSLLVWLYFMEGAVRAWSDRPPSHLYALAEALLSVLLFVACVLHARLRLGPRQRKPSTAT